MEFTRIFLLKPFISAALNIPALFRMHFSLSEGSRSFVIDFKVIAFCLFIKKNHLLQRGTEMLRLGFGF